MGASGKQGDRTGHILIIIIDPHIGLTSN